MWKLINSRNRSFVNFPAQSQRVSTKWIKIVRRPLGDGVIKSSKFHREIVLSHLVKNSFERITLCIIPIEFF